MIIHLIPPCISRIKIHWVGRILNGYDGNWLHWGGNVGSVYYGGLDGASGVDPDDWVSTCATNMIP